MEMSNNFKEGIVMKFPLLTTTVVTLLLMACGGGGGSSGTTQAINEIPANISVNNVDLTAGQRTALLVTFPKPDKPYQGITIDIGRTLEQANIVVTPR